jgi:hypothetical protein
VRGFQCFAVCVTLAWAVPDGDHCSALDDTVQYELAQPKSRPSRISVGSPYRRCISVSTRQKSPKERPSMAREFFTTQHHHDNNTTVFLDREHCTVCRPAANVLLGRDLQERYIFYDAFSRALLGSCDSS